MVLGMGGATKNESGGAEEEEEVIPALVLKSIVERTKPTELRGSGIFKGQSLGGASWRAGKGSVGLPLTGIRTRVLEWLAAWQIASSRAPGFFTVLVRHKF